MNTYFVPLNGKGIAFAMDLYTDCLGDAPQIFTVGAKEKIGQLKVIEDDLLSEPFLLFRRNRTLRRGLYTPFIL